MFVLKIEDHDVVVMRRVLLEHAAELEKCQKDTEYDPPSMHARAYRFVRYAQVLGAHAAEEAVTAPAR